MSCQTCKAACWPENPTVPFWNPYTHEHARPLCESCPAYQPKSLPTPVKVKPIFDILTTDVSERFFQPKRRYSPPQTTRFTGVGE